MSLLDYILIGVIALAVFGAIRVCIRSRAKGNCCGDCSNCGHSCRK